MFPSIELQGSFIVQLIEEANKRGDKTVEADAKSQAQWAETVQASSKATMFDKVKSWIQNDNVEGKKKYSAFFLAGLQVIAPSWRKRLMQNIPLLFL
jgi:cyclohexanone monooxygenase